MSIKLEDMKFTCKLSGDFTFPFIVDSGSAYENPDIYIKKYDCEIYCHYYIEDLGDNSEPEKFATASFLIFDGDYAEEMGENIYEIADSVSSEYHKFASTIYDKNGHNRYGDELDGCSTFVLDYFEVYKKFRGQQYGSAVIRQLLDNFGRNCSWFILESYPLQLSKVENIQKNNPQSEIDFNEFSEMKTSDAKKKLESYWKSSFDMKKSKVTNLLYTTLPLKIKGCAE